MRGYSDWNYPMDSLHHYIIYFYTIERFKETPGATNKKLENWLFNDLLHWKPRSKNRCNYIRYAQLACPCSHFFCTFSVQCSDLLVKKIVTEWNGKSWDEFGQIPNNEMLLFTKCLAENMADESCPHLFFVPECVKIFITDLRAASRRERIVHRATRSFKTFKQTLMLFSKVYSIAFTQTSIVSILCSIKSELIRITNLYRSHLECSMLQSEKIKKLNVRKMIELSRNQFLRVLL